MKIVHVLYLYRDDNIISVKNEDLAKITDMVLINIIKKLPVNLLFTIDENIRLSFDLIKCS